MKKVWMLMAAVVLAAGIAIAGEDEGEEHDVEVLEKNVRLDFGVVPAEEDDQRVFVIIAITAYQVKARFEGEEGTVEFARRTEV